MPSIVDLVQPHLLAGLATPANLRLGREIADQGGVALQTATPMRVEAKVGGVAAAGQRRTVELAAEPGGLRWSCACSRRADLFCKHCVAAAMVALQKA